MLLEHERNYDLGTDALVTVCSWNTNGASPGTWRTRSQTPSIPLNNPYSSPLYTPLYNAVLRSLDYNSYRKLFNRRVDEKSVHKEGTIHLMYYGILLYVMVYYSILWYIMVSYGISVYHSTLIEK